MSHWTRAPGECLQVSQNREQNKKRTQHRQPHGLALVLRPEGLDRKAGPNAAGEPHDRFAKTAEQTRQEAERDKYHSGTHAYDQRAGVDHASDSTLSSRSAKGRLARQ